MTKVFAVLFILCAIASVLAIPSALECSHNICSIVPMALDIFAGILAAFFGLACAKA